MILKMSAGRVAYLRQQNYAKMAAYSIQRKFDNEQYGKMKKEQQRTNRAKLKVLIEVCEKEFSSDSDVYLVLQGFFARWKKYNYSRNYCWAIENIRFALEGFSKEIRQKFESIVKKVDEDHEQKMKEKQKRKNHEEFKKQFMELQRQRKALD